MAMVEEPMLSRLDRLDNIVKQLEVIRGGGGGGSCRSPAKSSCASSGTLTSDDHRSSADFSPRSLEKHCRPIDDVIMETEMKGTLIERLVQVEDKVLRMCLEMDKELEKKEKEESLTPIMLTTPEKSKKKGLKQFVKSCVKGGKGKQHKS